MSRRTPIWRAIVETLRGEIASGRYPPAAKLPTELALAARFGVNRHTVRRALGELAEAGLIHSRRGAGSFVSATPTDYPLRRRMRFHQSLREAGRIPGRERSSLSTRAADAREAEALGLAPGDPVHVSEGVSLADGTPIALFCSVFPAARFPDLLTALSAAGSVTEALRRGGVEDHTRAWTRLTAKTASATQALALRLPEGAPILRTVGVNVDADGRPVEYGRTWFAGDRVTLTVANET